MKKTIIASVLGIAGMVSLSNNSQAQGSVYFANYTGGGNTAPVTYLGGALNGDYVGANFYANLLYSFGANLGVTYTSLDLGQSVQFFGATDGTGSPGVDGAGLFGQGGFSFTVVIPGYSSGLVDFIVQAYNGTDYTSSAIRGQSAVIQLNNLATAANQLGTGSMFAGDNTAVVTGIAPFTVSAVPEPSTLALAGLGGFGMLMALRRKKA